MSNGLTGEFDAVVEVRPEVVNRILGTLHQHGLSTTVSSTLPTLLHSFTARVGDVPKKPQFELAEALLVAVGLKPADVLKIPEAILHDVDGIAQSLQDVLAHIQDDTLLFIGPILIVRGLVKVQLSTPTITVPAGSTSEVMVHCQVRAHYTPDPGTSFLPRPIHGEVRAIFAVEQHPGINGKRVLEVTPTADNSKIVFLPAAGTGLSASETEAIAHQIRHFLKTKFEPMNYELPDDFRFPGFKSLSAGGAEAIALPLNLSNATAPASALNSVTNLFLKPLKPHDDHFAIAISKEYVRSLLDLTPIKTIKFGRKWSDPWGGTTVAYHVEVSTATIDLQAGKIVLTVTGSASVWGYLVPDQDYNFTITQKLTLSLDPDPPVFSLQADGDPTISGLPAIAVAKALSMIIDARDDALPKFQPKIQQALMDGKTKLDDALHSFDAAAKSQYTALEIQPDGLILRGSLTVSWRPKVVPDFTMTPDGTAYTALKSWIPAGTVENYVWSWVTPDPSSFLPWKGIPHEVPQAHDFIISTGRRGGPPMDGQVCLWVGGKQIDYSTGSDVFVDSGDTTCHVHAPDWLFESIPAWLAGLLLKPVWGPDPGPDVVLDSAIVAHVNAVAEAKPSTDASTNALIHFADGQSDAPLAALSEAVLRSKQGDAPLSLIVVLPRGAFQQTAAAMAERLGSFSGELSTPLAITEDYGGGWTRAFGVEGGPTTCLMSAKGELAWRHAGPLDAASLAAALDEHVIPGARPRSRLLRLAVQVGERVPDFLFDYAEGQRMALRKLRGRRVLVNFWKSWSTPCLAELRRLQRVHEAGIGQGPVILAIDDGEDLERAAEIGREHDLTFILVPDPERRIARRYGVSCWPTTVSIDEDGLVDGVHFGVTPVRMDRDGDADRG